VFTHGRSAEEALADLISRGETPARAAELAPHLTMAGNRQHNLLSMDRLTPRTLGALLSLWEHRTYFNAVLLGINAFDQWGVEMGKVVSGQIQDAMADSSANIETLDASTRRMLTRWREANGG
jgi:glucose-6-phosphate isomerase